MAPAAVAVAGAGGVARAGAAPLPKRCEPRACYSADLSAGVAGLVQASIQQAPVNITLCSLAVGLLPPLSGPVRAAYACRTWNRQGGGYEKESVAAGCGAKTGNARPFLPDLRRDGQRRCPGHVAGAAAGRRPRAVLQLLVQLTPAK